MPSTRKKSFHACRSIPDSDFSLKVDLHRKNIPKINMQSDVMTLLPQYCSFHETRVAGLTYRTIDPTFFSYCFLKATKVLKVYRVPGTVLSEI